MHLSTVKIPIKFGLHWFWSSLSFTILNRFINLGRPIFSLNHSGASAATEFTIRTTFGIAHAPCYTRAERATQSAARVRSSLFDFLYSSINPLRPPNCNNLQSDLSCLQKLNCNLFNHHERLHFFSLHRPAPAIRHWVFWLVVIVTAGSGTSLVIAQWLENSTCTRKYVA